MAAAWLAGGLVGLPTETVYGLAADAQDADAVARVYWAKGRPADHPLIVHVAGPEAIEGWAAAPNDAARILAEVFWPGPLTVIVARSPRAGDFITGGQDTVALRCPGHPVALACLRALVRGADDPARGVAAPSANRFGRVSPTRAADVIAEVGPSLDPQRDLVIDGGPCAVGVESTIVDCTADPPRVLRLGAISQAQVDAVLAGELGAGELGAGAGVASRVGSAAQDARDEDVRAPGTLESHYAPLAQVLLVEPAHSSGSDLQAALTQLPGRGNRDLFGLGGPEGTRLARSLAGRPAPVGLVASSSVSTPDPWTRLGAPDTPEDYARDLYAALRRADELGLTTVVAVLPDPGEGPLAQAVRDRLTRAAHGG